MYSIQLRDCTSGISWRTPHVPHPGIVRTIRVRRGLGQQAESLESKLSAVITRGCHQGHTNTRTLVQIYHPSTWEAETGGSEVQPGLGRRGKEERGQGEEGHGQHADSLPQNGSLC